MNGGMRGRYLALLCLLPFEKAFYDQHGVRAVFVGHPLADEMPLDPDRAHARAALSLAAERRVLALLPGSRVGEIQRLADDFLSAAARVLAAEPGLQGSVDPIHPGPIAFILVLVGAAAPVETVIPRSAGQDVGGAVARAGKGGRARIA